MAVESLQTISASSLIANAVAQAIAVPVKTLAIPTLEGIALKPSNTVGGGAIDLAVAALEDVVDLLTMPVLFIALTENAINKDIQATSLWQALGTVSTSLHYPLFLKPSSIRMSRQADVPESLMIDLGSAVKTYRNDTVAPRPRRWSIDAWVLVDEVVAKAMGLLGYTTGSKGAWHAAYEALTVIAFSAYVNYMRMLIDKTIMNRAPFIFKTETFEMIRVLCTSYEIGKEEREDKGFSLHIELVEYLSLVAEVSDTPASAVSIATETVAPV